MCVAYFAHELADPAVQRRVKMLTAGGCAVELLGFERTRFASPAPERAPRPHVLGRTESGKLVSRAIAVLFAIPRAWRVRQVWRDADTLLARNLEMLAVVTFLARLLRLRARVVYECLDIHSLMLASNLVGKLLRWVERVCLEHVPLVVTSSPAYEANYFRSMQRYAGETLIVENKVLALTARPAPGGSPAASAPPWKIAYCGVLRCRRSLQILRGLADALGERIEIEFWGVPELDQIPDFHDIVAASPRIAFKGRYKPEDLPSIYGRAHFVWAIDLYQEGRNAVWALGNRLYEGLCYGASPIAAAGVEMGRWLEARRLGVVLEPPFEQSLAAFLEALTPARYAELRQAVLELDPEAVAFTTESCRGLAARLAGAAA